MKNIEYILRHQYISFDIFDTLLKRSVAKPTDLFLLMEQRCAREGMNISAGFAQKRREAERRAHEKAGKPVGLLSIYNELHSEYGEYTNALMALEVQMELNGCEPNPQCAEWFRQCIAAGKTVVLLSDMYLPGDIIARMLEKCGIRGYHKLYVSCDEGAAKSDKSLYRLALKELGIRPGELLHIGDNRKSDFLLPMSMGIHVKLVRNQQKELCKVSTEISGDAQLAYRTLSACISSITYNMGKYERLGCETFGPVLVGFTQWLLERLRHDRIYDVYFMSRDGYMMKRAFDLQRPQTIRTHYLYCSRRSFTVPMLWKSSALEDVFCYITVQDRMTLRSFLLRIGLEAEKYAGRAEAYGIGLDDVFEKGSFKTSDAVAAFYESIRGDVEREASQEYDALKAYIRDTIKEARIAVVDIGYHGTMQNALEQMIKGIGLNVQVKGYYVGVAPDAPLVVNGTIQAEGYLYGRGKNEGMKQIISRFVPIWESVFLAQHGSVRRFVMRQDKVEPELCEYEYAVADGKLLDETSVICDYQNGALALMGRMAEAFPEGLPMLPPEAALKNFSRMGTRPKLWEAKLWGDFRILNHVLMGIARPRSLAVYLLHPGLLKKDYMLCTWKIGFMRRLLRIPLPYDWMYSKMKQLYHRKEL